MLAIGGLEVNACTERFSPPKPALQIALRPIKQHRPRNTCRKAYRSRQPGLAARAAICVDCCLAYRTYPPLPQLLGWRKKKHEPIAPACEHPCGHRSLAGTRRSAERQAQTPLFSIIHALFAVASPLSFSRLCLANSLRLYSPVDESYVARGWPIDGGAPHQRAPFA
jgi:hypothetical protein